MPEKKKFIVITDTHYFENSLGAYGEEYKKFMMYEQKCFAETQAINESLFAYLAAQTESDTILIAGDLVFNGEKESHTGFLKLMNALRDSGKKIYVITAGHDFNDHPFCFDDAGRHEPEGIKREELYDLYYEFGFKDAIAEDRKHLSYVAQIAPGIRLLALNNDGDCDKNQTYDEEQLAWIKQQCAKAREDSQMLIAMNHYPLLPGSPVFALISSAVMKKSDSVTTMLADEGVHLCFTGHMHNQSIKEKITDKGNKFYDVCTGSAIGCPARMRIVTVEDEKTVKIESRPVPDFKWDMNGKTTEEYFAAQFNMMIETMVDAMENDPAVLMRKLGIGDNTAVAFVFRTLGKIINNVTLGKLAHRLLIPIDKSICDRKFRDFAIEIVRNIFMGDQPYTDDTPEGKLVMKTLGRFSPILRAVQKKLPAVNGKPADIIDMVRHTIGNYGISDNNATLTLE